MNMDGPLPAHVASFYHLRDVSLDAAQCRGLACFAARADDPSLWATPGAGPAIRCLGHCDRAPCTVASARATSLPQTVECHARVPVLLERVLAGGACELARYRQLGGGRALDAALATEPGALLQAIDDSGLRGRGGAGFPAGRKWRAVAAQPAGAKAVVANADEGDAGAFSDRVLIEQDPFRLIEGMCIAAHAVGADTGYVYLRKEYPAAATVLQRALEEARSAGWLGAAFDIALVIGEGSYVAGEETAMLNAIENRRPQARLQPPRVAQRGLFGAPTLVNNVETLCSVPWIVDYGVDAYAALGHGRSRGTKLLSLNSLFRRPGLHEVEFGITLREIVERVGGGLQRGRLRALMVGGPLAGLLPPEALDVRLDFEAMAAAGAAVGHGGVIAFADDSSIAGIAAQVFRFGADESCARCVPCHRGTPLIAAMFEGAVRGERGDAQDYARRIEALAATSLCGHGRGLAEFAVSLRRYFSAELDACLR